MGMLVGVVGQLWRYPVKSMLGEELPEAEIGARGLEGDRALALLDAASGKVASAKNPYLWRQLLTFSASTGPDGDGVAITGPDGAEVKPDELSAAVGREVVLASEPPPGATLDRSRPEEVLAAGAEADVASDVSRVAAGTFFDYAPLHLLSTATLDRIAELSPRGAVEARRYRPNLVIRTSGTQLTGFAENAWLGRELAIGDELRLRITVPTPRCAVPTLEHGPLPRDPHALRVPARHNRREPLPSMGLHPCAGVYAQVLAPGRIALGDEVRLL